MEGNRVKLLALVLAFLCCTLISCVKSKTSNQTGPQPTQQPSSVSLPRIGFLNLGGLNRRFPGSPETQLQAFGVETQQEFLELNVQWAQQAGADWARMSLFYINGKLARSPEDLLEFGFDVMVTLSPRPQWIGDREPLAEVLVPYLRNHPELRIWQLGNEPDLGPPEMAWDPRDYVDFFLYTSDLIRKNQPEATIVLAGISNQYDSSSDPVAFYRTILKELKEHAADFDVFDFHFWGTAEEGYRVKDALATYGTLLEETGFPNKPIWVTELGTYSGCPRGHPPQNEMDQADFLRETLTLLSDSGVERICLGRLTEHFGFAGREGGFFDHTGLIYDGLGEEAETGIAAGTPKEAFRAVCAFTGGESTAEVQFVQGYRLNPQGSL